MPKKKVKKAIAKSSSQELFKKHKHLKWLLPLFLVVAFGFFLFHRHLEELSQSEQESSITQGVKQMLQIDTNTKTTDDKATISPRSY